MKKFLGTFLIFSAFVLLTITTLAQSAGPKLTIITPSEEQTIYGNKIPVLLSIENFNVVDYQTNPSPAPGQGHIHLWLDDQNPTAQTAVKVTSDNFTYSDVAYGSHVLTAELVTNDHKSLAPPQAVTVNFKNEAIATPSPTTTSGFDKNTALVIFVVVALVIIAAWWYTKEEDQETTEKVSKPKKTSRRKSKKTKK